MPDMWPIVAEVMDKGLESAIDNHSGALIEFSDDYHKIESKIKALHAPTGASVCSNSSIMQAVAQALSQGGASGDSIVDACLVLVPVFKFARASAKKAALSLDESDAVDVDAMSRSTSCWARPAWKWRGSCKSSVVRGQKTGCLTSSE